MTIDLLAIGDVNVDLLLQVQRFPQVDDEVQVERYLRLPGGDAANLAAAGAKLGLTTAVVACVGVDDEGSLLTNSLKLIGVNTDWVQSSMESKTGLVVGTVRGDGQRNLLTYRGANNYRRIWPEMHQDFADFAMLHISDPIPGEAVELAAFLKKGKPDITSIDPGSITAQRGLDELRSLLQEMKVCFLNESELYLLAGRGLMEEVIDVLLKCGPEIIVVKQGAKGCLVATTDGFNHVEGFSVHAVDATGAGDAFDAGFLYGLRKKLPLKEAARFANAVGALSTRALGAQSSQPALHEVKKLLSGES